MYLKDIKYFLKKIFKNVRNILKLKSINTDTYIVFTSKQRQPTELNKKFREKIKHIKQKCPKNYQLKKLKAS